MFLALFWQAVSTVLMFVGGVYASRLAYLLFRRRPLSTVYSHRSRLPARTVVILGSGGHTLEMTRLLKEVNPGNYQPRFYFLANTDKMSEHKVNELEDSFGNTAEILQLIESAKRKEATPPANLTRNIIRIPRSREVGQSYITSVFSTLYSFAFAMHQVAVVSPDLVLCNGPGTCVPICIAAFLLKLITFSDITIVYVESICRVKSLSLSARLLIPFVDYVLVQWQELADENPRCHYIGALL